jgi:DNA-binding transcriptional MerR regulator
MHFSENTYVTRGELAEELRVTKATIRQWETLRGFPQPLPGSGRVPLYKTADVAAWLEGAEEDRT